MADKKSNDTDLLKASLENSEAFEDSDYVEVSELGGINKENFFKMYKKVIDKDEFVEKMKEAIGDDKDFYDENGDKTYWKDRDKIEEYIELYSENKDEFDKKMGEMITQKEETNVKELGEEKVELEDDNKTVLGSNYDLEKLEDDNDIEVELEEDDNKTVLGSDDLEKKEYYNPLRPRNIPVASKNKEEKENEVQKEETYESMIKEGKSADEIKMKLANGTIKKTTPAPAVPVEEKANEEVQKIEKEGKEKEYYNPLRPRNIPVASINKEEKENEVPVEEKTNDEVQKIEKEGKEKEYYNPLRPRNIPVASKNKEEKENEVPVEEKTNDEVQKIEKEGKEKEYYNPLRPRNIPVASKNKVMELEDDDNKTVLGSDNLAEEDVKLSDFDKLDKMTNSTEKYKELKELWQEREKKADLSNKLKEETNVKELGKEKKEYYNPLRPRNIEVPSRNKGKIEAGEVKYSVVSLEDEANEVSHIKVNKDIAQHGVKIETESELRLEDDMLESAKSVLRELGNTWDKVKTQESKEVVKYDKGGESKEVVKYDKDGESKEVVKYDKDGESKEVVKYNDEEELPEATKGILLPFDNEPEGAVIKYDKDGESREVVKYNKDGESKEVVKYDKGGESKEVDESKMLTYNEGLEQSDNTRVFENNNLETEYLTNETLSDPMTYEAGVDDDKEYDNLKDSEEVSKIERKGKETYLQKKCSREKFRVDKQREGLKLAVLFRDALGGEEALKEQGIKGINVMYSNGKFKIQLEGKDKQLRTFELSDDQAKKFIEGKDKKAIYEEINNIESKQEKKMKMKNVVKANTNNYDDVQEELSDYSLGLGYMHGKLEGVTQSKKHWYNMEKTTYKNGEKLADVMHGEELEEIKDIVNRAKNIGNRFFKERNVEKIRAYAMEVEDNSNMLAEAKDSSLDVSIYKKGESKENEKTREFDDNETLLGSELESDDDKTLLGSDDDITVNVYKKGQDESLDNVKILQKLEKQLKGRENRIESKNNKGGIQKDKQKNNEIKL